MWCMPEDDRIRTKILQATVPPEAFSQAVDGICIGDQGTDLADRVFSADQKHVFGMNSYAINVSSNYLPFKKCPD